jgi:hypothetical protein
MGGLSKKKVPGKAEQQIVEQRTDHMKIILGVCG